MTIHTVYVRPAYAAEYIREGMLPHVLRLEIGDPGPHLAAAMLYEPRLGPTESQTVPRWSFSYDSENGRLARIDFHPERPDPETVYDEMVEALGWIRDCARVLEQDKSWHGGLLVSARLIAQDWFTRSFELRPMLTPPFHDASL